MDQFNFVDFVLVVLAAVYSWRLLQKAGQPPTIAIEPQLERNDALNGAASGPMPQRTDAGSEQAPSFERSLKQICASCRYASPEVFLQGARAAYEMVTAAFGTGDISACRYLLSPIVAQNLEQVLAQRKQRGETSTLTFIGFREAVILDAGIDEGSAWIDVGFMSELVSLIRDREGRILAGHPTLVGTTHERWSFERNLRARDPNWLVVATETNR